MNSGKVAKGVFFCWNKLTMHKMIRFLGFFLLISGVLAVTGHIFTHCLPNSEPISTCQVCQALSGASAPSVDIPTPSFFTVHSVIEFSSVSLMPVFSDLMRGRAPPLV